MPAPRVLVVQHEDGCPPALLGEWLADAGCDLDVVRPYAGDPLPSLEAHVGLLVLGGSADAWDPDVPWLLTVRRLVQQAGALGVPTLGVCLGHQLCALAHGGDVGRSPHGQQVGLDLVGWTADADTDDVVAPAGPGPAPHPAVFWNDDVVLRHPPGGATVLARTADGDVQAMRFGPTTWGVQWHPEATPAMLASWAGADAERHTARGIDQRARLAQVAAAAAELEAAGRGLADRFARRVHARETARVGAPA